MREVRSNDFVCVGFGIVIVCRVEFVNIEVKVGM